MKHSRVTIRYAKALLQLAIEQNILEQSYTDMVLLDSVFKENKDLSLLLKSPIVKTDQKLSIFKQIFDSKIGEVSMAFINIITTKKRESLLALIASSFISLYKEHNKIETASVITATPLDEILRLMIVLFGITLLAPPIQCWLNLYKVSVMLLRFLTPIVVVLPIVFVLWCWMCFAMKVELLYQPHLAQMRTE